MVALHCAGRPLFDGFIFANAESNDKNMQKIGDRHLTKLDEGIKSRFSIMVA